MNECAQLCHWIRSGCGKRLFEYMLSDQRILEEGISHPREMAIDRPSPKLMAFLAKYYGLADVIPQVGDASVIKPQIMLV